VKLQTKLNLATGIILFITLSIMIVVDLVHDREIYFHNQKEFLEQSAESLRNLLAKAQNIDEVVRTTRAFAPVISRPDRDNTYIVIADHNDIILAGTLYAAEGRSLKDLKMYQEGLPKRSSIMAAIFFHRHPAIHVIMPFPLHPSVTGEAEPVRGQIFISRSLDKEYREFLIEFTIMGIYAILLLTFLIGLFTYFFHHFITAPVNRLISGLKKVEDGNWEARVTVEHKDEIGTITEAFNRMAHQLQTTVEHMLRVEKMTTLGEMAARVAHEIRNPLVPIGGLANNLANKMPAGSRERSHLELIVREVKRLEKILESILIFTKQTPPALKDNDVNKIIAVSIRIVELYVEQGKIVIETDLASNIPPISCDEGLLEQALVNLFYNSVQAMEETGGTLRVKSSYLSNRERIVLEVTDTGGGIMEKDIHRIFDPFFTTKESGTGLGLSIVHQIVTSHHGDLMVHNHPGEGVTFIIELPVRQPAAEPEPMRPHKPTKDAGK